MAQYLEQLPVWVNVALFALGFVLIIKGADLFTDSAVNLAEITHIPKIIIGATIVSACTTLPEFSVSVTASVLDKPQTAIGNAVGSCICNIGLILGSCLVFTGALTNRRIIVRQGLFMLAVGVLLTLVTLTGYLQRWAGFLFLGVLAAYLTLNIVMSMRMRREWSACTAEEKERAPVAAEGARRSPDMPIQKVFAFFIVGGLSVVVGSVVLVQNASVVARAMGVPELVIGLTLVAIGTSLPEYVTAITSTIKGHTELSVGNIIGADFLDIVWVLGASALVRPLPIEHQTRVLDNPFMLINMVLLLVFGFTRGRIERWEAGVMVIVYAIYLLLMFTIFA